MKKIFTVIGIILSSAAVVLISFAYFLFYYAVKPSGNDVSEKIIMIPPGQSLKNISIRLAEEGIVSDAFRFRLYTQLTGHEKRIKAGEYRLSASFSPRQILEIMINGKVALYKITIPEGFNLQQIADVVSQHHLLDRQVFLQTANDASFVKELGIDADTFEGYLFPDTYHFPKGVTPKDVIITLVNRFREVFPKAWYHQAEKLGMTTHQVVTLASMIEKETGAAFERPLISSVFHNRLRKDMRLASDPTVIYRLKDFDGNLTRKHLETPTPYNTYTRKGLPPGPIANPGIEAIEAALYPDETDYLYFVSKKDGTHYFSADIQEHNRAVRKYQLGK